MFSRAATILHADADAFFASVEVRDDPGLRGRAVIVGGGVVMAASYEARAHGVHGGLGEAKARRLCPEAIWVTPRMEAYVAASRALLALFEAITPRVEPGSMEEAFLDVAEVVGAAGDGAASDSGAASGVTPEAIARRLRARARDELGLPITVGVARSKVLAKMASRAAKPDGLLVLAPERETAFLAPLPVERLYGVGRRTAEKLHARGLVTVADVAALAEHELADAIGRASARYLHAAAQGRDLRPVEPPGPQRSFGAQRALRRGTATPEKVDAVLGDVVARATRRMRAAGRAGRTVRLHLRFDDFAHATRSRTLPRATDEPATVHATARALLDAAQPLIARRGLTALGVSVGGLDDAAATGQLALALDGAAG